MLDPEGCACVGASFGRSTDLVDNLGASAKKPDSRAASRVMNCSLRGRPAGTMFSLMAKASPKPFSARHGCRFFRAAFLHMIDSEGCHMRLLIESFNYIRLGREREESEFRGYICWYQGYTV